MRVPILFEASWSPLLKGEDILLRMPAAADYRAWRELRESSKAFLTPWEPNWTDDELTARAYRQRLRRYRREAREGTSFTFFLFDRSGTTLLGGVTVGLVRRGVAQTCTLGYWMGERYAGAGRMHRAILLLKGWIFEELHLHRIEAVCLPRNSRSIRLLEKAGFQKEGYLRSYLKIAGRWEDHHLYACLASDPECLSPMQPVLNQRMEPQGSAEATRAHANGKVGCR